METSRAERGSSATMSLGESASKRVMDTLRFSRPRDQAAGRRASRVAGLELDKREKLLAALVYLGRGEFFTDGSF